MYISAGALLTVMQESTGDSVWWNYSMYATEKNSSAIKSTITILCCESLGNSKDEKWSSQTIDWTFG